MKKIMLVMLALLVLPTIALAAKTATGEKLDIVVENEIQARIDGDAALDERLQILEEMLQNVDGLGDLIERLQYLEDRLQNSDFDEDGYAPAQGDCDDSNPTISPGVILEPVDGIDNNCDGIVDNYSIDNDSDGYPDELDCNDSNADIFPGQTAWFDVEDDYNCNGNIDLQWQEATFGFAGSHGSSGPEIYCTVSTPGWIGFVPSCGSVGNFVEYEGYSIPSYDAYCGPELFSSDTYSKIQLCR